MPRSYTTYRWARRNTVPAIAWSSACYQPSIRRLETNNPFIFREYIPQPKYYELPQLQRHESMNGEYHY